MAREILFKAKRADNGEWVEGYYFGVGEKHMILNFSTDESGTYHNMYEIDPETLCQYTGLTDKNGNKIWENDIIKYHFGEQTAPIKYDIYQSCFDSTKTQHCGFYVDWDYKKNLRKDLGYWINMVDAEVIGNIFDNPELLEGGNE